MITQKIEKIDGKFFAVSDAYEAGDGTRLQNVSELIADHPELIDPAIDIVHVRIGGSHHVLRYGQQKTQGCRLGDISVRVA